MLPPALITNKSRVNEFDECVEPRIVRSWLRVEMATSKARAVDEDVVVVVVVTLFLEKPRRSRPTSPAVVGLVKLMDHRPRHLWTRRVATLGRFGVELRHVVTRCRCREQTSLGIAPFPHVFARHPPQPLAESKSSCVAQVNRAFLKIPLTPDGLYCLRYFHVAAHQWRCKSQTKVLSSVKWRRGIMSEQHVESYVTWACFIFLLC